MSSSFNSIDDLIRDYLNYRGLSSSLRTFENELSKTQVGLFRVDRIVEQLTVYIHQYSIDGLHDYWSSIEQRLLANSILHSHQLTSFLSKIRTNLYRCYLVHAIQTSKIDKVHDFFSQLAKFLQTSTDWSKEWFALPYIKNPEENSTFQLYFSKQWADLFWISLQNFLAMAFYHMTPPKICAFEENSSQSSGNLISQQVSNNSKSLLPLSARLDPSMNHFSEVLDEVSSPVVSNVAEVSTRPSNLTIISKFRNSFLPMSKHSSSPHRTNSAAQMKNLGNQVSSETATGNQISFPNDESNSSRNSSSSLLLPTSTAIRSKTSPSQTDESHFDGNEEKLVHLADLRHHSNTVIDCKFNKNSNLYSTLDNQSYVKIWSANEDFNLTTTIASRSSSFTCQAFDPREARLYLGTAMSTIRTFHLTEKRMINETVIDHNYPRIISIYPHPNHNRLFVSSANVNRLAGKDHNRTRTGRVSMIDLNNWTIERTFMENEETFVTSLDFQAERQILVLGFNDGKVSLYDLRSNIVINQKQQHSRFIQQISCVGDQFFTIANDNTIVKRNFTALDETLLTCALPYAAVGPFSSSGSSPNNDNQPKLSPSLGFNANNLYPMNNVFDFDPYNNDRILTCSANHGRFFNLSTNDEDTKLTFPFGNSSVAQLRTDGSGPSSCVHWNNDRDVCLVSNQSGLIQLYQRVNRNSY